MLCAVAALQKQAQGYEARALSAEQAAAALQQDVANWQGRYKKKDAELAGQASKVWMKNACSLLGCSLSAVLSLAAHLCIELIVAVKLHCYLLT